MNRQPDAFVRACLRLRYAPGEVDAVRVAAAAVPGTWDAVQALADAERLGPLLHRTVGDLGILPDELAAELRREYRRSALRNRVLLDELGTCLRACAAAGVPVIALKGAALAEGVYRDIALRPMVDVDLLIRPGDRALARQVLEQLGYAAVRAEIRPGALAEHENEIEFCKPGGVPMHVDLHWNLFDSPHYQQRIDPEWLWQTARPARIAGEPAQVFGPEAQVLHLSGHLVLHHAGHGLLWWQDLAEVLVASAGRLDWDEVLARARRYDLQLVLRSVLVELAEQWRAPVPATVVSALRALHPSSDEAWLFARLAGPRPSAGQRFWTDLASISGWHQRWRFAIAHLFPSPAYMRQRYAIRSPLLLPLYYPYRWLRGMRGEP